jgi:glutamyl-Q tRNA(Asp) synthetase
MFNLSLLKAMSTVSTNLYANYVGRFAPSPTGPLHFGSLVAAVASYCDAKSHGGKWLVRMEDLDKPREVAGAANDILHTLEIFGFEWDSDIVYQSNRADFYADALNALQKQNLIYACTCTRKEIADSTNAQGIDGLIYPKTCANKHVLVANIHAASRAVVFDKNIAFLDAIQGEITQNLARDVGDFIVKRADSLFAYQLAVVVDDALQNITHIVRGADLLDSTPRQIYLQQLLGFITPHYSHLPVAVNAQGEKLSKQTLAIAITPKAPPVLVFQALQFLGQNPPKEIKNATLDEMWQWAFANWQLAQVPKIKSQAQNSLPI